MTVDKDNKDDHRKIKRIRNNRERKYRGRREDINIDRERHIVI